MAIPTARVIAGVILLFVSLVWFFYALRIAFRESSFVNAVGWAIPFALVEISIYLVVTGTVEGRYGVVLSLAVCGSVIVIGGATVWLWRSAPRLFPMSTVEVSVFSAAIGIGILLMLPLAMYLARRAETT